MPTSHCFNNFNWNHILMYLFYQVLTPCCTYLVLFSYSYTFNSYYNLYNYFVLFPPPWINCFGFWLEFQENKICSLLCQDHTLYKFTHVITIIKITKFGHWEICFCMTHTVFYKMSAMLFWSNNHGYAFTQKV